MKILESITDSPEQTQKVAAQFVTTLEPQAVVGLMGSIGAGKTTFIQGMARGLGIDTEAYVTSPTFTLINEYSGPQGSLFHFDLYRLSRREELFDIGLEDYIAREGICVLEWVDRIPGLEHWLTHRIQFEILADEKRGIRIEILGA